MLPLLSDKSALIIPAPGLMIWTLVIFAIVFFILNRYAFGPIADLLDQRRASVRENLEAAESARDEAQRLLEEYRAQLADSRREASEIVERARKAGEAESDRLRAELAQERDKGIAAAQAAIQAETRQSLEKIKSELADLTLLATERMLGRVLDAEEQNRLLADALSGVDFSRLEGSE